MSRSFEFLVDAAALRDQLDEPQWRLFDCRHDLTDRDYGRRAYAEGHLPGARFLHLDEDLSGPMTGSNGRHPLPDPDVLAARLRAAGVDRDTQVVAYDDAGGMFAARLWWLMRWLGHRKVAVLDGGLAAWRAASGPLSTEVPTAHAAGSFQIVRDPSQDPVDAGFVLRNLGQPGMRLLDARSPDRFRGENETLDPVGGHIPGARNRFFRDNLVPDGRFKSPARLREEFEAALACSDPSTVIHSCGSGVTACHNLLAMELAGLSGSRLYAGSWSEWCADPSRPVAVGS
ncbi:MAG: sulfurtransferase [Rhodocyclaceae bacterium]|nr:sulfurtransferase [Rhodocyclaceae bacterium]